MLTLLILALAVIVNFLVCAYFLQVGVRWMGSERATFLRALLASLSVGAVTLAVQSLMLLIDRPDPGVQIVVALVVIVATLALSWWMLQRIFQISYWRSALAWLISQLGAVVMAVVAFALFRPFLLEAFRIPTNAMAPTIVGQHYIGICPQCSGEMIVPASARQQYGDEEHSGEEGEEKHGICTRCLKTGSTMAGTEVRSGDLIICNKLLSPRRWDLIVFRLPPDPSQNYIKRLVGLPGETLFIRDGKIWINGQEMQLPEPLANLEYVSEIDGQPVPLGREDRPLILGKGEYAVLGDFSARSADSRFWGPVPHENLLGVGTVIYWPPSRWRVWRSQWRPHILPLSCFAFGAAAFSGYTDLPRQR